LEQRLELVRGCKYLASAALDLGYHRRAESLLCKAEAIREALAHGRFAVGLATIRCRLDWSSGRWEGLEARTRDLMEATAEAAGMFATNELTLAWLLLARGEVAEAERRFASVLEVVRAAGMPPAFTTATSGLATIRLAQGDRFEARELATMGLETIDDGSWVGASAAAQTAVDALVACDETAAAEDLVRRFAAGSSRPDAPAASARLEFCRGLVAHARGRRDSARRSFARAEGAFRRLPSPYEAACAH
jgi:tetratricopeptide (TPR) repeat protein